MEQVKLTRKELYDLVWAEPLSRLAKTGWHGRTRRCHGMIP
jgi:hypothetical protein